MHNLAALAAADLVQLAADTTEQPHLLREVAAELRRRKSRAARAALEEVEHLQAIANGWRPDLEVAERFEDASWAVTSLREIWEPRRVAEEIRYSVDLDSISPQFDRDLSPADGWSLGFSSTFKKSIATADKKTQGRVMVALSDLADAPMTPRGDTVKPLSNALKGLWRYRIGDYRLIYEPRAANNLVVLVDFVARGGAYSDA